MILKNIIKKVIIFSIFILVMLPGITTGVSVNKNLKQNSNSENKSLDENQVSDNWTMFMHDSQHSGFSDCLAPNDNIIKWSVDLDASIYSSPAVFNNKIYVATRLNGVHCINAENGEHIWISETKEDHAYSSVAVYKDKLYVGGWSGLLFCLNLSNGEELWNFSVGGRILTSPAIYNDKVYFGSNNHNIYCINASDGKHIWNYTTGDNIPFSSPAIYDDKLYIGSDDKNVYCINASDGEKIWNYTTGNQVWSSPTVYDNKVFISSLDKKLYCLNAITGEKIWNKKDNSIEWSLTSIYNNSLYVGSGNNTFYRLNPDDGSIIWKFIADDGISGSSAIADKKVYFSTLSGHYYCLNAETGKQVWLSKRHMFSENPVVYNGKTIFCEKYFGRIYCFGVAPKLEITDFKISGGAISANISNNGNLPANNVTWEVVVNKGILKRKILKSNDSVVLLNPGETITISTDKKLSCFGKVYIKINATSENVNKNSIKRYRGYAFGKRVVKLEKFNIKITKPEKGLYLFNKKVLPRFFRPSKIIGSINITAKAIDKDNDIEKVEFYINGKYVGVDYSDPYKVVWKRDRLRLFHLFVIKVVSYEYSGDVSVEHMVVRRIL